MNQQLWCRLAGCALSLWMAAVAHADFAGAQKAYAAKEFERAYLLFRELAEIGNVAAQENLAAMYVDGEGVKRDNVLGFAWASIARENGGSAAMQNIIDQLAPHLNDAAKARVAEAKSLFGKAALQERLLPAPAGSIKATNPGESCRVTQPANPDDSYPDTAKRQNLSGTVAVDAPVLADGKVHHPVVLYSIPEGVFDNAARANVFATGFAPKKVGGAVVPCVTRYKIVYRSRNAEADIAMDKALYKARAVAEAGDPVGQALYALLLFDRAKPAAPDVSGDWFLKSAQGGVPFAQYVIGVGLIADRQPDTEKAKGLTWLKLAAASGQADAKFALANYSLNRDAAAMTDAIVFAWLEDAAKANHRDATLTLAALLATGPDANRREPARAIDMIAKANWDFASDPTAQEVLAAANARLANFDEAQAVQRRAVKMAKGYGWNTAPLEARLATYVIGNVWTGNLMTGEEK